MKKLQLLKSNQSYSPLNGKHSRILKKFAVLGTASILALSSLNLVACDMNSEDNAVTIIILDLLNASLHRSDFRYSSEFACQTQFDINIGEVNLQYTNYIEGQTKMEDNEFVEQTLWDMNGFYHDFSYIYGNNRAKLIKVDKANSLVHYYEQAYDTTKNNRDSKYIYSSEIGDEEYSIYKYDVVSKVSNFSLECEDSGNYSEFGFDANGCRAKIEIGDFNGDDREEFLITLEYVKPCGFPLSFKGLYYYLDNYTTIKDYNSSIKFYIDKDNGKLLQLMQNEEYTTCSSKYNIEVDIKSEYEEKLKPYEEYNFLIPETPEELVL